MDPLRPQLREPVTFVQRVLYSDAFDRFLGVAVTLLLGALVFSIVFSLGAKVFSSVRTQGHAEVSGTTSHDAIRAVSTYTSITTGEDNIAIGSEALRANMTTGPNNIVNGHPTPCTALYNMNVFGDETQPNWKRIREKGVTRNQCVFGDGSWFFCDDQTAFSWSVPKNTHWWDGRPFYTTGDTSSAAGPKW